MYGEDVQGYPSLIITFLFLGGLQLLSIGILGEYIGRIFNETKNRPANIAREKNGERIK
jgi:glycosyltransferase involved in cell wall biosynthesis